MMRRAMKSAEDKKPPLRSSHVSFRVSQRPMPEFKKLYGLNFDDSAFHSISYCDFSELHHEAAKDAFALGIDLSLSADVFVEQGRIIVLPCGFTLGSHIMVIGKQHSAHGEKDPKIALLKDWDKYVFDGVTVYDGVAGVEDSGRGNEPPPPPQIGGD
ncbi:hypothetical protein LguiB_016147 [Lonicera macranthoides]